MSAREKAKAKAKHEKEQDEEFFRRTGIRNESEDHTIENLMDVYEYDMAVMAAEEKKKRADKKQKRDRNNIDPETGKPYVNKPYDEAALSSDLEDEHEELLKKSPTFQTREFQERYAKRKESREK